MTVIKGSVNVGKTPTRNRWGEIPIFPFDFEKLQKYLGVYIRHDGKISLPQEDKIRIKLERLRTCQLNPIQKVQVIRQSICSSTLFQLPLSDHGLEEARKLNLLIRGAVKRIIHLPSWNQVIGSTTSMDEIFPIYSLLL